VERGAHGVDLAPAAPSPAYVGFSIIPALLVVPEPIADLAATNVAAGSDVVNLLNDDPMSVAPRRRRFIGDHRSHDRASDRHVRAPRHARERKCDMAHRAAAMHRGQRHRGAGRRHGRCPAIADQGSGIGRQKHYHGFRR
jgi:hypothetical protein